jgi:hypothetical protein
MALPELSHSPVLRPATSLALDRQLQAEHAMVRSGILGVIVTLPIAIAVFTVLMALAIGDMQPWYVWTGLGIGMGAYAAGFFGTTAGVLLSAHKFDQIGEDEDHHVM